jgi:glycosyltransferase involved in cell wall biosynthesis
MRILHLVHQYPPEFMGGVELYTQTLAQQLVQRGHAVSVFAPSPAVAEEAVPLTIEAGVRVYRAPLGRRSPAAIFASTFGHGRLSRAWSHVLDQVQPDLVHIQHMMGLPVELVTALQRRGLPLLVTLHDYYYFCANALLLTNYDQSICSGPHYYLNCGHCAAARLGHDHGWAAPFAAPFMAARNQRLSAVLREARQIITPTRFVAEICRQQFNLSPDRLSVITHGVAAPDNIPPRRTASPDRLRVVFVGGIAPHKGVHVLIEAVNALPDKAIELSIYGDVTAFPDYAADLRQRVRHSGITFRGQIPHAQIWEVLRNSDLLVAPALAYESSSLIIQEAFAMQTPVVASDLGALRETTLMGGGRLFSPGAVSELGELLRRFCEHPAELEALRAQIRPVRTIEQHTADIETCYSELRVLTKVR